MVASLLLVMSPIVGWALGRLGLALTGVDVPSRWLAPGAVLVTAFCLVVSTQPLPISLALGWCLLLLAAIDVKVMRLPDTLTLPLTAVGLGLAVLRSDEPLAHVIAAAGGLMSLAGLDLIYVRIRGRSGLGLGDAKLYGAAGAWLGWRDLPVVLLIACAGGLIWFAILALAKGDAATRRPIAFGAPLCVAILIVWEKTI